MIDKDFFRTAIDDSYEDALDKAFQQFVDNLICGVEDPDKKYERALSSAATAYAYARAHFGLED